MCKSVSVCVSSNLFVDTTCLHNNVKTYRYTLAESRLLTLDSLCFSAAAAAGAAEMHACLLVQCACVSVCARTRLNCSISNITDSYNLILWIFSQMAQWRTLIVLLAPNQWPATITRTTSVGGTKNIITHVFVCVCVFILLFIDIMIDWFMSARESNCKLNSPTFPLQKIPWPQIDAIINHDALIERLSWSFLLLNLHQ